jgi:exonuclease VII small subunit
LVGRWQEPETGSSATTVSLTEEELVELERIVRWLNEHNADLGATIPEFELCPTTHSRADLTGLKEVLDELFIDSRYQETNHEKRFEYYTSRLPEFEERLKIIASSKLLTKGEDI